jgi:5'-nucleotidase/UDP-sugar diphosphatase
VKHLGFAQRNFRLACLLILLTSMFFFCSRAPKPADSVHLVLLHVNDTHGHLFPHDYGKRLSVGGAARLAGLIKRIRGEFPGRTLLLHAGDIFSRGGPLTVHTAGGADMRAMQAMGFDAMVPGNGEFYTGVGNLKEKAALVDFPVLLANVYEQAGGESLFPPFTFKKIAGVNIAVLGLGFFKGDHPATWSLAAEAPVAIALRYVPMLRDRADLVIALTHLGVENDEKLAAKVPGLDVIVGGHSHRYFEEPQTLPGPAGQNVVFVEAGIFGTHLGRLDLFLTRNDEGGYTIDRVDGQLIPITAELPEDPEVARLLKELSEPLDEVLCVSHITLDNPPQGPSPIGDFLVKAIHDFLPAQAAVLFRPAVQSGILPGPVTVANVCRVHSWRSRVLRLSLTGEQLTTALGEQEVFASGCEFRKSGEDIRGLKIAGVPVDPRKTYDIVADEAWLMNLKSLQRIPFRETGERVDTILMKRLRELRELRD